MVSPEELDIEADLKSDAAKVLEEEAGKLEVQGNLIRAQAEELLQLAHEERLLVLHQQHSGVKARMQSSVSCKMRRPPRSAAAGWVRCIPELLQSCI